MLATGTPLAPRLLYAGQHESYPNPMAAPRMLHRTLFHVTAGVLAAAGCASTDTDGQAAGSDGSLDAMGGAAQTNVPTGGGTGSSMVGAGPTAEVSSPTAPEPTSELTAGGAGTGGNMPGSGGGSAVGGVGGPEPVDVGESSVPETGGAGGVGGSESGGTGGGDSTDSTGAEGAEDGGAAGAASEGELGPDGSGEAFAGKELFILIGQSNMSGMSPMPSEPWPINERVTFMVQFDCESLGQTAGEWLPAEPPLHGCQWATGGIGLGLADFFGAKLAEEWPTSQIGLIPNAVPGQLISIYLKEGGTQAPVPPEYANAYEMTVERSMKAQEQGRIRAILLHQGESDDNQGMSAQWLDRVATVIADLRADLNLGEAVPLLAGQIGPSQWEKHNAFVDQIPDYVPNSAVISSEGTAIHDIAHFDEASAKLMGERYVEKFLEIVPEP